MGAQTGNVGSTLRAVSTVALTHARYWTSVAPQVRKELAAWTRRAETIPDPRLRAHALQKLRDTRAHAETTATLAIIASRRHRRAVIAAIVALEVMYDYLDALGEQPVADPLRNGLQLFAASSVVFLDPMPQLDYYSHHPQAQDGGYLHALASTARGACRSLPSIDAVAHIAVAVTTRCAEAQTRAHAVSVKGVDQLREWAETIPAPASSERLLWWESAAGMAGSVVAVQAVIAAASHPGITRDDAIRITDAYLLIAALATLLDNVVDRRLDAATGAHSFISYYADDDAIAERIAAVAHEALRQARSLPNASHHQVTVAGVGGYYLSTPEARTPSIKPIARAVTNELNPTVTPIIAGFRLWRAVKRRRNGP